MAAKLKKNHFVIHPDGLFRFRIAVIMRVDRRSDFGAEVKPHKETATLGAARPP